MREAICKLELSNQKLLETLKEEGVEVFDEIQKLKEGKFSWIMNPEGNKIELWEPNNLAFL